MQMPNGQIRATPLVKKFQRCVHKALTASKYRKNLWHRLYDYVRCIKIASIKPEKRSNRQCRELSDWIWSQIAGNNILSRVHYEDRAKVAQWVRLNKIPSNTLVSLQNQEPDAFKILLGGICSEWRQTDKRSKDPVLEKMPLGTIKTSPKQNALTQSALFIDTNCPITPTKMNKKIASKQGSKTMPNRKLKRRKRRKLLCKSPQRMYHREKNNPQKSDIEKQIAPLLALPGSQLRRVSLLPGEATGIMAMRKFASPESEDKVSIKVIESPSPKKMDYHQKRLKIQCSFDKLTSPKSKGPRYKRSQSIKSIISTIDCVKESDENSPMRNNRYFKKSMFGSLQVPEKSTKKRRRSSMIGEMVTIQKEILKKFVGKDVIKENAQRIEKKYELDEHTLYPQSNKKQQKERANTVYCVKQMGKRVDTLKPGNNFDSLILFSDEFKSTSSIITDCECEFLYLLKKDLNKVLKLNNRHRLRTKVLSLETIPTFQNIAYSARLRLSNISKIRTYLDGADLPLYEEETNIVFRHGQRMRKRSLCYWILSGKCEVVTNKGNKVLVQRNWGSMLHEYGLLECQREYYHDVIEDNQLLIDLHRKVKVKCVGKCEFIRFYWDELITCLPKSPRIKILKLARNYLNQILYYMQFANIKHLNEAKLFDFKDESHLNLKSVNNKNKKNKQQCVASKIFDFEPDIIREADYKKLNKLQKSVSTTHLLLPQLYQNNIQNKTFQKLSSSISFCNLLRPQTMVNYVEDFNKVNNVQISRVLEKQPTPRTLSRVINGQQNIRSVFTNCAERMVVPRNIQNHLNSSCQNEKNKNEKISVDSKNVLLRDVSNGTLSVFF